MHKSPNHHGKQRKPDIKECISNDYIFMKSEKIVTKRLPEASDRIDYKGSLESCGVCRNVLFLFW